MGKIYTLGETVLDLLFRNQQLFQAVPGGAMLNTAVSLGRLRLPVFLISEYGQDAAGDLIQNFLETNHVETGFVHRYTKGNTALSLASLAADGNASYSFYRQWPEKRLQMTVPEFQPGDFLLFGSFFALDPAVRIPLKKLVLEARNQGALILYDPNFRSNHLSNLPALLPSFYENLSLAHLVRGSHEDFGFLLGTQDPWEIDAKLSDAGSTHQIVTTGAGPVHLFCNGMHISVPPAPVTPVSTIGAGDTFNAGVLYGLHARNAQAGTLHSFPSCEWSEILTLASTLAANTCSSYENYISEGLATQINEYI